MNLNQTACDLCAISAPADQATDQGYSTVSVQGRGRTAVQSLFGAGASTLDVCPACMGDLAKWLSGQKEAKAQPLEVPAKPISPAIPVASTVPGPAKEPHA